MSREYLNPPDLFPSLPYGFSQGVVAPPGRTIYLSGQVAWNEMQEIVGQGDLRAQARQALSNVEKGLKAAGATMADVVSLRIYIVQDEMGNGAAISDALKAFFPEERAPASTWIGVTSLAREDFLVEIEAIAQVLDGAATTTASQPRHDAR